MDWEKLKKATPRIWCNRPELSWGDSKGINPNPNHNRNHNPNHKHKPNPNPNGLYVPMIALVS